MKAKRAASPGLIKSVRRAERKLGFNTAAKLRAKHGIIKLSDISTKKALEYKKALDTYRDNQVLPHTKGRNLVKFVDESVKKNKEPQDGK